MSIGILLGLSAGEREDDALSSVVRHVHAQRGGDRPRLPAGTGLVVAAGSTVVSIRDTRRSLLEAEQVANAAMHEASRRKWYRLPDVRVRGLHLLRDDFRLQTYVERELGPLIAFDEQHGTDLLGALDAYLRHGGNKSAAAEAVCLSRPAFCDRLRRVERVLGVEIAGSESQLSFYVAVLALEAVRETGTPRLGEEIVN